MERASRHGGKVLCACSLMDRASDCGSEGCEFESHQARKVSWWFDPTQGRSVRNQRFLRCWNVKFRKFVRFAHEESSHSGQLHEFRKLDPFGDSQVRILYSPQRTFHAACNCFEILQENKHLTSFEGEIVRKPIRALFHKCCPHYFAIRQI